MESMAEAPPPGQTRAGEGPVVHTLLVLDEP